MTDRYPIRAISQDEFPGFYAVLEHAFNPSWTAEQGMGYELPRFEFDRSLGAFDGSRIVGTAGAFSFDLTLPGSAARAAGVSAVSVLPSHRRRGILSALMRRQLDDVRARGEAIAVLFASESPIYGRFGYGPGSRHSRFSVLRGEGRMSAAAPSDPGLELRIADPQEARAELAKVYDGVLPGRAGFYARDSRWWDAVLHDEEFTRGGMSPLRCMVVEDASGPRGYALFSARPHWGEDGLPAGEIQVRELMSTDPAASAALWADLLSRDLSAELTAGLRPVDDPLLHLLADPRRARQRVSDGLWVRLVDVPRALTQRRYAAAADVVIEVTDELCPWNQGRWRLTAPAGGAGRSAPPAEEPAGRQVPGTAAEYQPGLAGWCEPTSAPADVVLPVSALGAAFLGGTRLGELAAAGLVSEVLPGATATLSAALSWDPAPWCPMIF